MPAIDTPLANRIRIHAAAILPELEAEYPEWLYPADSPLKYISWALEETVEKSYYLANTVLNPFTSVPRATVAELGPGTGYLMAFIREMGHDVLGFQPAQIHRHPYSLMNAFLGNTIVHWGCTPAHPFPEFGCNRIMEFNYIVATQVCWMDNWSPADYLLFLSNCQRALTDSGHVILSLNPKAVGGHPIRNLCCSSTEIKHLGKVLVI